MVKLRIGSPDETSLQASKWIKNPTLLEVEEMKMLFDALGPFHLFLCSGVIEQGKEEVSQADFLRHYAAYIDSLKEGRLPDPSSYRRWFSIILTGSAEAVYITPLEGNRGLVRIGKPIIQVQAHDITYSPVDGKFRSLVFGADSIPWGIQFSYPLLYRDEATMQIEQTRQSAELPNTELFHILQRWMRAHTIPTTFEVEGVVQAVPIRIGRQCLSWINQHIKLKEKGIRVHVIN